MTPDPRLAALRAICQDVLDADEACAADAMRSVDHQPKPCNAIYTEALARFHAYVPAGEVLRLIDERDALAARLAGAGAVVEAARAIYDNDDVWTKPDTDGGHRKRDKALGAALKAYDEAGGEGRGTHG